MGRIGYIIIALLLLAGSADAATVVGQAKFSDYSTNRAINQSTTTAHIAATTTAHGGIVATNDTRLTDSRPASDVSAWAKSGTKPSYTYSEVGAEQSGVVSTHSALTTGIHGSGANSLIYSNDSRLTDSRTPTAHSQAETTVTFTDITTGNATTSAHGFAPKGTAGTTQFWRQDWTLATPSGGGGGVGTMTRLTGTWASSATANTTGIIGTGGVPMTSPTYGAAAPFSFTCHISTTRAATTNGPRYGVAPSSGTVTRISATHMIGLAATTRTETKVVAAMTTNCAANCSSAMTTGTLAQVEDDFIDGTGVMNASGTISLYMAPSAAAANTAQIGSYCIWY